MTENFNTFIRGATEQDQPADSDYVPSVPNSSGGTNKIPWNKLAARVRGPVLQSLSGMGFINDGSTIGYGGSSAGSDQTAAIQTAINNLSGNATGVELIWDIAVGIGGQGTPAPLLLPSNFTLHAPNPSCGAILRTNANIPMIRNAGAYPNDVSTSNQNTWGKIDPSPGGNTLFRILDPSYVANTGIKIIGGTWNGNRPNQNGTGFHNTYGVCSSIQMYGVYDLEYRGLTMWATKGYFTHGSNCQWVKIRDMILDGSPISGEGADAVQWDGPNRYIWIDNQNQHANDDHIALNADTWLGSSYNSYYGGSTNAVNGVNVPSGGNITNVLIRGLTLTNGIENKVGQGGIRIISQSHLVDDIVVDGVFGQTNGWCFPIGTSGGGSSSGNGNINKLVYRNIQADLANPEGGSDGTGVFTFSGNVNLIEIEGKRFDAISGAPYIFLGSAGVQELHVIGDFFESIAGSNQAYNIIEVANAIIRIEADVRSGRDPSLTIGARPVVKTSSSANVQIAVVSGHQDRCTNVVDHQSGTLTRVDLTDVLHSNAGGGSPFNIANGLTTTDLVYNNNKFNSGSVSAKSGAGTVTNNNSWTA